MSLVKPTATIEADLTPPEELFAGLPDTHLLTPGEVAAVMRVDPKTVTRWASARRVASIRTPGGHRRFRVGDLRKMIQEE